MHIWTLGAGFANRDAGYLTYSVIQDPKVLFNLPDSNCSPKHQHMWAHPYVASCQYSKVL